MRSVRAALAFLLSGCATASRSAQECRTGMTESQVARAFAEQDLRWEECQSRGIDDFFQGKLRSSFVACWYRDQLEAMEEIPLPKVGTSALRFLWLRTFDEPVMVRVDFEPDGTATLVSKVLDGSGGYLPGCIRARRARRLDATEAAALRGELADAGLIPVRNRAGGYGDSADMVADGARWILERVDASGYRVDDPTSPGDSPDFAPYVRLCRHLLELADIRVPEKDMY
jgi:hypothetical protein